MEETGENGVIAPKFSAFLSYSHADAGAVQKLHGRLESYRLPTGMGAISALNDRSGEGLGKVFRDREDLSAAHSLSEAVVDALGRSEVLVVVCSPEAKTSRWVAEEIAQFRKLRPGKPILAALVRGEPEEAFPKALTEDGNEPLAADLRREGDGWRLGFLKIVAGIAGVPLDSLIQRDSQRRMRRVMAVTGVAVAAALVMAIMTTVAIQSRNEARDQRAEAEGLIEYMLTDLRLDLKGVGRLDVMTGVNDRAMQYYENADDLALLPAESLDRRARIIEAMAEDDESLGEPGRAREKYEELKRITAALLKADPQNADRILSHAKSENRLAVLANSQGDIDTAMSHLVRSWAMLRPHLSKIQHNEDGLRTAAYVNGNLCAAYLTKQIRTSEAISHCRTAIAHSRDLIAKIPDDYSLRYDLVFHLSWLSDAYASLGRAGEEASARRDYLKELDRMIADQPRNMLWQEQRMEMLTRHAKYLSRLGKTDEASAMLNEALDLNERLTMSDPSNSFWSDFRDVITTRIEEVRSND